MNEIIFICFFFTILSTGVVKQMKFDIMEYWNLSWKSHGILGQQVCTNPVNNNVLFLLIYLSMFTLCVFKYRHCTKTVDKMQYNAIQYNTIQYNTIQYVKNKTWKKLIFRLNILMQIHSIMPKWHSLNHLKNQF